MLSIAIPSAEFFDERTSTFTQIKEETFVIEHSLVSISKWESKWCKPFLGKIEKTCEEILDYIRCMTVSRNVNPEIYLHIPESIVNQIVTYINSPMTATWFTERGTEKNNKEIITSEIIYYWMISLNVPMECQKWHLNRLLTLIRVCNIKNTPPKKIGRKTQLNNQRALNEARRNQLKTKG